ncbi:hypothetical protein M8494_24685 [Serratia ureilytica]
MAFLAVAVRAALTLLLLLCVLPPLPVTQAVVAVSPTAQRANRRLPLLGLLLTFLLVAGHFMGSYTFVRPLPQTVAGIESRCGLLSAYGVAGTSGILIAGQAVANGCAALRADRPWAGARRPAAAAAGRARRAAAPSSCCGVRSRRFRVADGAGCSRRHPRGRGRLFAVQALSRRHPGDFLAVHWGGRAGGGCRRFDDKRRAVPHRGTAGALAILANAPCRR